MAHFIGFIQGSRGQASRLGTKSSGLSATARAWDVGGSVECFNDEKGDFVRFVLDGGSNAKHRTQEICEVRLDRDGNPQVRFADKNADAAYRIARAMEVRK